MAKECKGKNNLFVMHITKGVHSTVSNIHLHNVLLLQLRAPGSVVIIVGTHMDMIKDQHRVEALEHYAQSKYSTNTREYPKVSVYGMVFMGAP